jgi:hypothetical protein
MLQELKTTFRHLGNILQRLKTTFRHVGNHREAVHGRASKKTYPVNSKQFLSSKLIVNHLKVNNVNIQNV